MECVKCGHTVNTKYCPNCGHSTETTRFDGKFFFNKLIGAVDLSKGFFVTLYRLVIQPGTWLRRFITGEITEFSNPIKLFLIVGAITNFLTYKFNVFNETTVDSGLFGTPMVDINGYYHYSTQYFSFFTLTAIPLFALTSWLCFRKSGFNYSENLVFNLYVGIGQFLLLLVFIPMMIAFEGQIITNIYGACNALYNVWALVYFFRVLSIRGILISLIAVAVPQVAAYFMNYVLYRIMPEQFWTFLDNVLG